MFGTSCGAGGGASLVTRAPRNRDAAGGLSPRGARPAQRLVILIAAVIVWPAPSRGKPGGHLPARTSRA